MQAPKNGFSDRDLTNYFQRIYKPATRTPTRAIPTATSPPLVTHKPESKKSNVGAIAGGAAAGGVAFLLLVGALIYYFCVKRKRKSQSDGDHHSSPEDKRDTQQNAGHGAAEVNGEARGDNVAELPTIQSPMTQKSGLHSSVASISSNPTSTTYSPQLSPHHSPPHSPPPQIQPLHNGSEGSSLVYPHGVPFPPHQQPYLMGHPYPAQQPYPGMQSVYSPQSNYMPPQQFYTHPPPPPQQYMQSYVVQGPDIQAHPHSAPDTRAVPRKEIGSVSSTGSSPGAIADVGGEHMNTFDYGSPSGVGRMG